MPALVRNRGRLSLYGRCREPGYLRGGRVPAHRAHGLGLGGLSSWLGCGVSGSSPEARDRAPCAEDQSGAVQAAASRLGGSSAAGSGHDGVVCAWSGRRCGSRPTRGVLDDEWGDCRCRLLRVGRQRRAGLRRHAEHRLRRLAGRRVHDRGGHPGRSRLYLPDRRRAASFAGSVHRHAASIRVLGVLACRRGPKLVDAQRVGRHELPPAAWQRGRLDVRQDDGACLHAQRGAGHQCRSASTEHHDHDHGPGDNDDRTRSHLPGSRYLCPSVRAGSLCPSSPPQDRAGFRNDHRSGKVEANDHEGHQSRQAVF